MKKLTSNPTVLILQARKPCGCVTAATLRGHGFDATGKWRGQYEREGYEVTVGRRLDASFFAGCSHGLIEEQTK